MQTLSHLPSEIDSLILRKPQLANSLALKAYKALKAGGSESELAEAGLLLLQSHNAIGNFCEVVTHSPQVAQIFLNVGNWTGAAHTWLESAWAQTYLGNLDAAEAAISSANGFGLSTLPLNSQINKQIVWLQARIQRDHGNHTVATQSFEKLLKDFKGEKDAFNTARLLRELGHTHTLTVVKKAQPLLEEARILFEQLECPIDVALCDLWLAQMFRNLNDFPRARILIVNSRDVFLAQGHSFYTAWCDLGLGWVEWGMNHFEEALQDLDRARRYFLAAGADSEVSSCEINIAGIQLELSQFEEALPTLQHALKIAQVSGRRKKAAICLESMGWAYDRQGRYAQAVEQYLRAREEFAREHMIERMVMCDLFLGLTYFNLGQYTNALATLDHAITSAKKVGLPSYHAEAEMYRGQILLALRKTLASRRALSIASTLFTKAQQPVYVAFCQRLLAKTYHRNRQKALNYLASSRRVFQHAGQRIEAALCDLTKAELEIEWHENAKARRHLRKAREILQDIFPDMEWRIHYGLGKIALAQKHKREALHHYTDAAQKITMTSASQVLEEWSNNLSHTRQHVIANTLKLARGERAYGTALAVIESNKAQLFTQYVMQRDWRIHMYSEDRDGEEALEVRERELRHSLETLRIPFAVQIGQIQGELLRSSEGTNVAASEFAFKKIHALTQEYETIVARLRLRQHGLSGVPTLSAFSLEQFRNMAQARWGRDWAALDYYLVKDQLTIAYLDVETLDVQVTNLSRYDQFMLDQCTSTHPDLRELIYGGTIHGIPAPALGLTYLKELTRRLIPARILAAKKDLTLIVSPHGSLHQLPFHALMEDGHYLLERFPFVYTPSLQAFVQLSQASARLRENTNMLLCGLHEFGTCAPSLSHTLPEIQALKAEPIGNTTTLWQSDATRQGLLDWNRTGQLGDFDILHFATHAVLEPQAPHWSRILLQDDNLTVLDIMDLRLNASLVTLSACATALGPQSGGDEIVGLARAFFYAGARTLVSSLWSVDDESTQELMTEFYRNLKQDHSIADALRAAQLHLLEAGHAPFHWAAFGVIGKSWL